MPENVDCTSDIRLLKRPDIWLGFLIIWRPTISTFPTAAAWPAALAPPIAALRSAGFVRVVILAPWCAAHSFRAILSNGPTELSVDTPASTIHISMLPTTWPRGVRATSYPVSRAVPRISGVYIALSWHDDNFANCVKGS